MINEIYCCKNIPLLAAVLLLICLQAGAQTCPQLCTSCLTAPCETCYSDWPSDSDIYYSSTCSCPVGYYMNSTYNICNFCPVQCIRCNNYTSCTLCLEGYRLTNGACLPNFINSTAQIAVDLNNSAIAQRNAFGFRFDGTGSTRLLTSYFQYCGVKMSHQGMMGRFAFTYNSAIYKTYYGLPYHQWAAIKFQFFILDGWQNQALIIEVEMGRNQNSSNFTSSYFEVDIPYDRTNRNSDFCGLSGFSDSLGMYNQSFMHTDSMLKFRIRTSLYQLPNAELPPNKDDIYFGIRQILLIVGVCPSNCLTCSSRSRCGRCKELYTLDSYFKCVCDTSVAILTENGMCIKGCNFPLELLVDNKCKPCGQQFGGCVQCANRNASELDSSGNLYKCIQCTSNKYLYQGYCVNVCPPQYYEQYLPTVVSNQVCTRCPVGCEQCQNNEYYSSFTDTTVNLEVICQTCLSNYLWYNGRCYAGCPDGTYPNNRRTLCINCPQGCLACQSESSCTQCLGSASNSTIYLNQNGLCVLSCISTGQQYNPLLGCPNTTCSANCETCFGNLTNQCFSCSSNSLLENFSCVLQCSTGYYQPSPIARVCLKCPPQCKSCTDSGCLQCNFGYWLLNGNCLRLCPITFYAATMHSTYECLKCTDPYCNVCTQLTYSLTTGRNTSSQCQQCASGFYLDPVTGRCVTTRPICLPAFYFNLQVQDCVKCPLNCLQCQSTLCLLCESNKLLNNGACVDQCPLKKNPFPFATRLVNGTNLTYNKCVWTDPLCEFFNVGTCFECIHLDPPLVLNNTPSNSTQASCLFSCPDGYAKQSAQSLTCSVVCPSHCLECDGSARCTKCQPTYLLNANACVSSCPQYYMSDSIQCIRCDVNCIRCQQDGKCVQCRSGLLLSSSGNCYSPNCSVSQYNPATSSCVACTSPCATCTASSTQCTSCIANYYIIPTTSTCSGICLTGQFADAISRTCRPCRYSCSSCSSFEVCTQCIENYYLIRLTAASTYCVSECPPGTFISNMGLAACLPCKFPCRSCFGPNDNQCLECVSGFKMDYTTCLASCPVGKYEDEYGHCDFCHPSCRECFGPADFQCSKCHHGEQDEDDGYQYEGRCYKYNCPATTFYSDSQQKCRECNRNCRSCSSSTSCSECDERTVYWNRSCVERCPYTTYYSQSREECRSCSTYSSYCSECTYSGCTRCVLPYYRYDRYCVSACPLGTYATYTNLRKCLPCPEFCQNCTSPTSCKTCKGQFRLRNGICLQKCISGYYYNRGLRDCRSCQLSYCSKCYYNFSSSRPTCIECQAGYKLTISSNGQLQCVIANTTCSSGYFYSYLSKQCEPCHIACWACSNSSSNCTQCRTGYRLVNGMCVNPVTPPSCVTHCAICSSSTICTLCNLPYYLIPALGTCVSSCPADYYASLRECSRCGQGCQACANSPFECSNCESGYLLLGNRCITECPDGYFTTLTTTYSGMCQSCSNYLLGCEICDNSTSCSVCKPGYSLLQNLSRCYAEPTCPLNYYYSYQSQGCTSCPDNCAQCFNSELCLTCEIGYAEYNGSCINSTSCPLRTFYRVVEYTIMQNYATTAQKYTSGECTPCTPPCYSCLSQQICLSCVSGYVLANSSCIIGCGLQYYSSNSTVASCQRCSQQCLSCRTNSTTCTSCRANFYLFNKKCVAECPIGMYKNSIDNQCRPCGDYCLQCTAFSTCEVCYDGLWLMNGECVAVCPRGYAAAYVEYVSSLFNKMVGVCRQCEYPCSSCAKTTSQYECQSCVNGFYLFDSRCLVTCPTGYFPNLATSQCTPCPSWCLTCTSYQSCQTCTNAQCLQPCQIVSPSTCVQCENSCKYCDKSTIITVSSTTRLGTCLQCIAPNQLYNGRCYAACPSGTRFDSLTNRCVNCVTCSLCAADGQCLACNSTAYLYQGLCYAVCPTGTLPTNVTVNGVTTRVCLVNPCVNVSGSSSCSSCLNPYVVYNEQCTQSCPNSTYKSSSSNTCEQCPSQCRLCTSYNNCTGCMTGYLIQQQPGTNNWVCLTQCTAGTYRNMTNLGYGNVDGCVPCTSFGCRLCSNANTCAQCTVGLNLYYNATINATICVLDCPNSYYPDSGQCMPCLDAACQICTYSLLSGHTCLKCLPPTSLVPALGRCVATCLGGYFLVNNTNSSGSICQQCPPQCLTCSSPTNCSQCSIGYNLLAGQCVAVCPFGTFKYYNSTLSADTCLRCNITTSCIDCVTDPLNANAQVCVLCSTGWFLLNGMCYSSCPAGYFPSSAQCRRCSSPCLECSSATTCTRCYNGSTLNPSTGTCTSNCTLTQFYQSSTRTCQSCSQQCYQCFGFRFDQCLSCVPPLVLVGSTCAIACPPGYTKTLANTCLLCDSLCKQCTGSGSTLECTSCPTGSFMYLVNASSPAQGQCVKSCPSGTYQNPLSNQCTSCSTTFPFCLECQYNQSKLAVQCSKCSASSITVIINNEVTCQPANYTCPPYQMYVDSLNRCVQCSATCLRCGLNNSTMQSVCYECAPSYYWYDGQCYLQCPQATAPIVFASVTYNNVSSTNITTCLPCQQPNCISCSATSSNMTQCVACLTPYILYNGSCVQDCGSSQLVLRYNPNTLAWQCTSSSPTVDDCKSKGLYQVINSTGQAICVEACPPTYFADASLSSCRPCIVGCQNCTDGSTCLVCLAGFIRFNSQCLSECPVGYLAVGDRCLMCVSPCATCSNSLSSCTTCVSGYKLLAGTQCVQTCPLGYFVAVNSTICSACNPQCSSCSSLSSCLTCTNLQYSPPQCTDTNNTCLSNQYRTSAGCFSCNARCATCFGPADYQCITCAGSYVMMDGLCLASCPLGFYSYTNPNTSGIECAPCSGLIPYCSGCSVQLPNYTCTSCSSPYLLSADNTRCTLTCSQLNTNTTVYSKSVTNPNQCVACTSGCSVCLNQNCISCNANLYLVNGQCLSSCPPNTYGLVLSTGSQCAPCTTNCVVCSNGQSCIDCAVGYVIENGKCVSSCSAGSYPQPTTTILNTTSYTESVCTVCITAIPHCTSCQYLNSAAACSQCQSPYVVFNGTCRQCLISYFYQYSTQTCVACNPVCLECVSATNCTSCASGLLMVNNQCVYVCPTGLYANYTSATCLPCTDAHCDTCTIIASTVQCQLCQSGYYLISTSLACSLNYTGPACSQTCPPRTSLAQRICQLCTVSSCQTCAVVSTCDKCLAGYFLTADNTCVTSCPIGTAPVIIINGTNTCGPCKTGCVSCTNSTNTCLVCLQGLVDAGNGQCQQNSTNSTCPSGQYVVQISPLQCGNCHSSCLTCYGGSASQCITCPSSGSTFQSGYCISACNSTQFYNSGTSQCQPCNAQCLTCQVSSTSCTSCPGSNFLTVNNTCQNACPTNTYRSNLICQPCPTDCATCTSASYCNTCSPSATIYYNNVCYIQCPTGTYVTSNASSALDTCMSCPPQCLSCTSSTCCQSCSAGYYLHVDQCVQSCPLQYYGNTNNNTCESCLSYCQICTSASQCSRCQLPHKLYNNSCVSACPPSTYSATINGYEYCESCSDYCLTCTNYYSCSQCAGSPYKLIQNYNDGSISCTDSCPTGYVQRTDPNGHQYCDSGNCTACEVCTAGKCDQCIANWFLQNSACTQSCLVGTYGANDTWKCQPCMDNCIVCPNATYCSQCTDGYNFSMSLDNKCVVQSIFTYGQMANISGFTSNITEITSLVYLSTSAGPVFFGEMSSTYFNIEFCQFMFFHDGVAGNNSEMKTFLQSLSFMSMSSLGSSSNTTSSRRLLLETESLSFLQINLPIFIMMGCFLILYGLTFMIQKYIDSMCLSCPNFNFYVKEICIFLSNRFKWIYFDFVVWLSYLPFLYFSIKQVQKFNFNTALEGFSSIFSVIVLITYPLYPVLIAYNIKKNYVALCMENDKILEMSMSPWVYKVKRPEFIPNEGESFVYCSKANLILLYYPLKYFRKFIFVLIVVVCPDPVATLGILLGLNVVFIGYMGGCRPRVMPYMIFDFILEGVMLAFEIFMVAYMILDSAKLTAMTIVTHAFGFISANLSIIIAIVLNIVAYYKIFMCIYELYQHIKEKIDEKQKLQAKQKDAPSEEIMSENAKQQYVNDFLHHTDFVLDDKELDKRHRNDDSLTEEEAKIENLDHPEREIANLLSDKDLIMNNIQPRYDGDIQGNDNFRGLFDDKQLYGDENPNKNQKFKVYEEEELPAMKMKKSKKDRSSKKNLKEKNGSSEKKQKGNRLDETNQYVLHKKQERWAEQQREENVEENNFSAQRLSYKQLKPVKAQSINELNTNKIEPREKSKTLNQSPFKTNGNNNKQDLRNAFLIQNKNKLMDLDQEDGEGSVIRNASAFSGKSGRSNDQLLNGSPEQLLTKQKQRGNIQIKQGRFDERKNKNVKPIEKQFDEFAEGQLEQRKQSTKNKKLKQEQLEQYHEGDYEFKNRNPNQHKMSEDVPEVQLGERKKKIKPDVSNEASRKNLERMAERIDQLGFKEQSQKDKSRNSKDLQQGRFNEREKVKRNGQPSFFEPNVKEGKTKEKGKILSNFLDQQQHYFQENATRNRDNQKAKDQALEEGLLISRKPISLQNRRQKDQKLQQLSLKNREGQSKQKQENKSRINSRDQSVLEEGKVRDRSKNKQGDLKLKNRANLQQEMQTEANIQFKQRIRSQNEKNNEVKVKEIEQGLFSERFNKQSTKNQKEKEAKNIQELITKQRNSYKKGSQQGEKEEGGFFSNLFGFNKKQKLDDDASGQKQHNYPASSRFGRKDGDAEFEENDMGSRPKKSKKQQNRSKDKGLKRQEDGFNQDYDQIKRKNKESMMKPKINYGTLDFNNGSEFQESNYSRPASRLKRMGEEREKDNGLNMDRRGSDVSDSEDFGQNTRKVRAANKQKMRGKGNLDIQDRSMGIDDSQITRKRKEEDESVLRRGGKGVLKIKQTGNEEEEDLENIQL